MISGNKAVRWQKIVLSSDYGTIKLSPRYETLVAPFSDSEIIIMGGRGIDGNYLGDAYILNTRGGLFSLE